MDKPRQQRPKLLAIGHSAPQGRDTTNFGGSIELFSDTPIDCKWVLMPHLPDTARASDLSDHYLETVLPRDFQALHRPQFNRLQRNIYKLTPEMIARAIYERDIAAGLRDIRMSQGKVIAVI